MLWLGVTPLIVASVIVEAAAWATPRWNQLRHAGVLGRAKLWRATIIVTLILTLFQAYSLSSWMGSIDPLLVEPGLKAQLLIVSSSLAGVCVSILIALAIGRHGFGNGFVVLFGVAGLVDIGREVAARVAPRKELAALVDVDPPAIRYLKVALLLALVALVAVACWLGTRPVRSKAREGEQPTPGSPSPYRTAGNQTPALLGALPTPASGLVPLALAAALLSLPGVMAAWGLPGAFELQTWLNRGGVGFVAVHFTLVVALTVVLSSAFNHPRRVLALWRRVSKAEHPDEDRRAVRSALDTARLRTVGLVVVVWAASVLSSSLTNMAIGAVELALLTALVIDMVGEHRARKRLPELVGIWPEHRSYAVELACRTLAAHGIRVHARNAVQRRMLQGFGPYVPVELMVPQAQAEEARALLTTLLVPDAARNPDDETESRELERSPLVAPGLARELHPSRGLLLVALAMLLIWLGGGRLLTSLRQTEDAGIEPANLEVLLVDDTANPLAPGTRHDDLPAGVKIEIENVPLGPGRYAPRSYLRVIEQPGQNTSSTLAAVREWLAGVELPNARRWMLTRRESVTVDGKPAGSWRSYLVDPEPVFSSRDLVSAEAQPPGIGTNWTILIQIGEEGAERFLQATRAHVKRRLAIVVDGEVYSAPVVQEEISGGSVLITMGPEQQRSEAIHLVASLRRCIGAQEKLSK